MKRLKIILISILFVISMVGCGESADNAWQEQFDLGMQYLTEGNYEEAILAFTAVIEIDPKLPEAYRGLADAYAYSGDMDKAMETLQKGFEATKSDSLNMTIEEYLKELNLLEEDIANDGAFDENNLTGCSMFTFDDLEEWGYPMGMTTQELIARGEADDPEYVKEWLEDLDRDEADGKKHSNNRGHGLATNPDVFFSYGNRLINSVDIMDEDSSKGPRGIALGMKMEEVLNLFYCSNPAALEYALTLDDSLFTERENSEGKYIPIYENKNLMAYINYFEHNDSINLSYHAHTEGDGYPNCDINISFTGDVVSSIFVNYNYD